MNNIPETALSNIDLDNYATLFGIKNFRGCYMRDELIKLKSREFECGVLNLNLSTESGSHWVCWFKQKDRKYYFNSFGLPPPKELIEYLGSPILYSTFELQGLNDTNCGKWCLKILKKISDGEEFCDCILSFIK